MIARHHLTELPVTPAICAAATSLPPLHRDPFSRIIIATALRDNLTILTSDTTIPTCSGVTTCW